MSTNIIYFVVSVLTIYLFHDTVIQNKTYGSDFLITRLKQLRKFLKLSQKSLAQELGITQTAYSMIETGVNPLPDRYIKVVCSLYNVNETWLRTGEGEMFISTPYSKEFSEIFSRLLPETQSYLLYMAKELLRTQEKLLEHGQEQNLQAGAPEQLRIGAVEAAEPGEDQR